MSDKAKQILAACAARSWQIRCAESCTAGLIMAELTSLSGASAVVDRGYVTYSNQAKEQMLGVQASTLATYGAVSAETAFEMVTGTFQPDDPPIAAISVTGIAGPNGGTAQKPVGTVWIGTLIPQEDGSAQDPLVKHYLFSGDRDEVRQKTVKSAFTQLLSMLHQAP